MLLWRQRFDALHRRWLVFCIVATVVAGVGYAYTWWTSGRLPGGGSLVGLILGLAAGLICLFEFALVIRKTRWFRARHRWLGNARLWMAAHIWLGLLAVPLVLLHSGFSFGGTLSSWLAWSFIVVIASGVFGLVMQNVLPRFMIEAVPEETIYSQIDNVGLQFAADAVRLARLYGGPGTPGVWTDLEMEMELLNKATGAAHLTEVGAPRRVGTMTTRARQPKEDVPLEGNSPELHAALETEIVEFLRSGRSKSGRLNSSQQLEWYFDDLRRRVRPEARAAVDQIHELCQRRRQLNLQKKLHVWLHGWLSIHLPLSVALIFLLAAHVVGAILYS